MTIIIKWPNSELSRHESGWNLWRTFTNERSRIMTKPLFLALLAVAGTMIFTNDAFAGCRRNRCCSQNNSCCAAAPTCAAGCNSCIANSLMSNPSIVAAPTTDSVVGNSPSNNSSTYQSYSYEPGASPSTAPAPTYQSSTVMVRQPSYSIFDSVLRGDRKVHGQF